MKPVLLKASLMSLLLTPAAAQGQVIDDTLRQKATLRLGTATPDDHIIALARAAKVSVFADATQLSAAAKPLSLGGEDALLNWLLQISHECRLSWQRQGEKTFLFWSEPDVPELAQVLLAAKENQPTAARELVADAPTPPGQQGVQQGQAMANRSQMANRYQVALALVEYLQNVHGWDGNVASLSLNLKLSSLPADLQAQVLALAHSQTLPSSLSSDTAWLSSHVWEQARLGIMRGQEAPVLTASATINGRLSIQGFAFWGSPVTPRRASGTSGGLAVPKTAVTYRSLAQIVEPKSAQRVRDQEVLQEVQEAPLPLQNRQPDAAAAKVSMDVRRVPLVEVLAILEKQTGVRLRVDLESSPARARVTALASDLPLAEAMDALARLYAVSWTRLGAQEYSLETSRPEWRAKLAQAGDLNWFRYWQLPTRRAVAPMGLSFEDLTDWEGEIAGEVDIAALTKPGGVAISSLSAPLQAKVRRAVQDKVGAEVVRAFHKNAAIDSAITLRFGASEGFVTRQTQGRNGPVSTRLPASPDVTLYSSGGERLLSFGLAVPRPRNEHSNIR
jgi:hypothetical protein